MLAAFDAVFLVFTLTLFCISAWSEHYNDFIRPWLTPYMLPGKFTSMRIPKLSLFNIHLLINKQVHYSLKKAITIIPFQLFKFLSLDPSTQQQLLVLKDFSRFVVAIAMLLLQQHRMERHLEYFIFLTLSQSYCFPFHSILQDFLN